MTDTLIIQNLSVILKKINFSIYLFFPRNIAKHVIINRITFPGIPPFRIPPPPPGAYTPSLPPVSQQRFPIGGMQHAPNTQLQSLPYFDSRIPPPTAPPPPYVGQNLGQNLVGMNPAFSDPARNPVPYG